MPRYDDERDERGDYRDGPPRKSSNTGLIIGIVSAVVVIFGVVAIGCLGMLMWGGARAPVAVQQQAGPVGNVADEKQKKTYTRAEFTKLVMGKTMDEVKAALGKPDTTQERATEPDSPTWYYDKVTVDPVTGKKDDSAQVIFEKGKVARINY
jgi:hypothetical protein